MGRGEGILKRSLDWQNAHQKNVRFWGMCSAPFGELVVSTHYLRTFLLYFSTSPRRFGGRIGGALGDS